MKKGKVLFFIISIIIILAIAFSVLRFIYLNNMFPNPEIVVHESGELVDGGEISVRITRNDLYNGNKFEETFRDYNQVVQNDDGSIVSGEQYKVLFIYMDIINKSSVDKTFSAAQFYAETLTWANGIDAEVYGMVNKDENTIADPQCIELKPNEKKTVILTYMMYYFQFQQNEWEEVNINNFDLSLSRYPVKHIVSLT